MYSMHLPFITDVHEHKRSSIWKQGLIVLKKIQIRRYDSGSIAECVTSDKYRQLDSSCKMWAGFNWRDYDILLCVYVCVPVEWLYK